MVINFNDYIRYLSEKQKVPFLLVLLQVVIRCRASRRMTLWKQALCAEDRTSFQKGLDYPLISTVRSNLIICQ